MSTATALAYQYEARDFRDAASRALAAGDLERSARMQRHAADCYRHARRGMGVI